MDIRYIADDIKTEFYTARVCTRNSILIKMPSWDYSLLHCRDAIAAVTTNNVTNAMDDALHGFDANKSSRQWKYLVLEFPSDHELSSKLINGENAGEDEDLELEILEFGYTHEKIEGAAQAHYAAWRVARADARVYKRGKLETKTKTSAAANILGSKIGRGSGSGMNTG